jgi:phosphatidate cytidylyltransferase
MSLSWILISFSSDAGALITGSLLGSHQCCPAISPKKTWEGLLGAVIGGVGAGAFFFIIGLDASGEVSLNDFLIFGLIAAVFGMIGDLTESGFKRYVSTKDSSDFLPGHGGFLDRLDALGSCAVPIYYYCKWRGW